MLFKPALNYFYLFFDRSYSEKAVFFLSRLQVKGDRWSPLQPLGASMEVSKSKRNGSDLAKSNRKVFSSHWELHNKKHGKVCPQLPPIFPASTVLNVGIALQSRGNGTNNLSSDSPATVSFTITEILFLLRRKCPTANIYLFPILPQFDHNTLCCTTSSFLYFQVQEFFLEFFFPTSCHPPYIIKMCTGLINSTSPQKAMKFL